MKFILSLLLLVSSAFAGKDDALNSLERASVYIKHTNERGIGSGTIVRADETGTYVITNKHICDNLRKIPNENNISNYKLAIFVRVVKGKRYKNDKYLAQVIKVSDSIDLCLLHSFKARNLVALELADYEANKGENSCNLGNPYPAKGVFKCGKVAGYIVESGQILRKVIIETGKGSSGSPLVDYKGKLLGIMAQYDDGIVGKDGKTHSGKSGLYVPIRHIKLFLGDIFE